MQLVTALQSADNVADLTDLANAWSRVAVFHIDETLGLGAGCGVVVVIRNIAGAVFDEVIVGIVTSLNHALSSCGKKSRLLGQRHIKINRFEESPCSKAPAQIRKNSIWRPLPLLD